ncbi:MAG TPA: hypothetical protein PKI01_05960 [Bacteroidales bacterium]|nr:hypothetical protein [Bacteroidales bacterium]
MKKIIIVLLFISGSYCSFAQHATDTLRRASGFYIAPAATGMIDKTLTEKNQPGFGLNFGYRWVNKFKYGLFIESGVGISWLSAGQPITYVTVNTMGRDWTYSEESTAHQLYVSAPFLFGYKAQKGKVRFQTSLGMSFNIKYSDFRNVTIAGEYPYGIPGTSTTGDIGSFGTSFSGIFKAGISIPVKERLCIDLLPAIRYNFVSTTMPGEFDFRESVTTDFQNWSAGLDISLIWSLDNKPPLTLEASVKKKERAADYTYQYNPDEPVKPAKEEKVKKGPYNFFYFEALGSGLTYSFNYERTIVRKDIFSLQARGGYGFFGNYYSFPIGVNVSFGHATQKFEAGIYSTFENLMMEEFNVNIVPELAYRLETKDHFFLRLAMMSHYVTKTGGILPGIGISVGGCF